jgi:hypothetical protein
MAICINCGKKFSPSRGDARYCSNRCRLVTFRNGIELATTVKHHLSFGTTLDGDTDVQVRLREVMNAYPDAVRKFGEPMIRAALSTKPAPPRCRWDLAWMWASRLDQPKPRLSRAGRTLLRDPCSRCTKRMQPQQQPKNSGGVARPGAERPTSVGPLTSASSTRAAQPDLRNRKHHDPLRTCSTCREYRRTHPGVALTAGGMPEGCPPHSWNEQPRPPKWAR